MGYNTLGHLNVVPLESYCLKVTGLILTHLYIRRTTSIIVLFKCTVIPKCYRNKQLNTLYQLYTIKIWKVYNTFKMEVYELLHGCSKYVYIHAAGIQFTARKELYINLQAKPSIKFCNFVYNKPHIL